MPSRIGCDSRAAARRGGLRRHRARNVCVPPLGLESRIRDIAPVHERLYREAVNRLAQGFSPYALTRFRDQIAIPPVGTLSRRDFRSQPGVLTRETHPHNDPPCRGGRYLRSTVCLVNLCKREAPLSTAPSASPTRYAGAIRTWRSAPILQHSITPRGRIRGRERSALLLRLCRCRLERSRFLDHRCLFPDEPIKRRAVDAFGL